MDNLQTFWTGLSIQRRAIVAAATVGMFAIIMLMARAANAPDYALLYAGLDANSAGEVIVALDATGATYDVRGTSIFVESATRDQLRMTLAAEGLPASSTSGYEILEKMTGFGTTSQMFDAAYWRAKEGELARTITGSSGVKSARVHISNAGATPFQRNDNVTASVTLQTAGLPVNASQARAIQFLVASAVTGLTPASVTVIDGQTGSIISADADAVAGADREGRSVTLQKRVERLMAARVGPHSYVVEVSVETDLDEEVMVERTLDPDSRVIISTDSEERSTQANDSVAGGAVTVASNLPTGDAAADDRSSSSQNASNRERINYDVSATEREVKRAAGSVKRITVAVMVDGVEIPDAAGTPVWQPRDASEIEALEALVQSAIGFDADRGDTVTIRSLQFDASIRPEPLVAPAESGSVLSQLDLQSLIQFVILGGVALAIGLFVIRPALRAKGAFAPPPSVQASPPAMIGAPAKRAGASETALTGTIEDDADPFPIRVPDPNEGNTLLPAKAMGLPLAAGFATAQADDDTEEDPVARLRKLIEDRREETVEILRGWMEETGEKA